MDRKYLKEGQRGKYREVREVVKGSGTKATMTARYLRGQQQEV